MVDNEKFEQLTGSIIEDLFFRFDEIKKLNNNKKLSEDDISDYLFRNKKAEYVLNAIRFRLRCDFIKLRKKMPREAKP